MSKKLIKKVSTTPLSETTGEIVDSMSASVDTHTNAPSISAVKGETTAINGKLGNTDISSIGDGTVTGAIGAVNKNISSLIFFENISVTLVSAGQGIVPTRAGCKLISAISMIGESIDLSQYGNSYVLSFHSWDALNGKTDSTYAKDTTHGVITIWAVSYTHLRAHET